MEDGGACSNIMQAWSQSFQVNTNAHMKHTKHICYSWSDHQLIWSFKTWVHILVWEYVCLYVQVCFSLVLPGHHTQISHQTLPGTVWYVYSDILTAPLLHNGCSQAAEIFKPRPTSPVCPQHIYHAEQLPLQHTIWYLIQKLTQGCHYCPKDEYNPLLMCTGVC